MTIRQNPHVVRRMDLLVRLSCLFVLALSALVLSSAALQQLELLSRWFGQPAMKLNLALSLAWLSLALWLVYTRPSASALAHAGGLLSVLVFLVALLTLSQDLLGWQLGIDQWLGPDQAPTLADPPGRMSPFSAILLLLLASGVFLLYKRRAEQLRESLAIAAGFLTFVVIVIYLYEVGRPLQGLAMPVIAPLALLCFVLLSAALFCTRPLYGLLAIIASDSAAGLQLRTLLPLIFFGPILLGWFYRIGIDANVVARVTGFGLLVIGLVLLLFLVSMHNALFVSQQARLREQELAAFHASLEQQVAERTTALLSANAALRTEVERRGQAEEQLRASQNLLQAILDHSPLSISVADRDGTLLMVNRFVSDWLKIEHPQQLSGRSMYDLLSPDLAKQLQQFINIVVSTGVSQQQEIEFADSIGMHTINLVMFPINAGNGVILIGAIGLDLSARKQIEIKLQRHASFQEALIQFSRALMAPLADQAAFNRLLTPALELLRQGAGLSRVCVYQFVEPAEPELSLQLRGDAFAPGWPSLADLTQAAALDWSLFPAAQCRQLQSGAGLSGNAALLFAGNPQLSAAFAAHHVRFVHLRTLVQQQRDWGLICFECCEREHGWNEQELLLFQMAAELFDNALDRMLTSWALQRSEERLRVVFDVLQEGVLLRQRSGELAIWNAAAARILGYSPEQMNSSSDTPRWQPLHQDGRPMLEHETPYALALQSGQPQRDVLAIFRRLDGVLRWLRVSAVPLFEVGDTQPAMVVTSFSDVTDFRLAEAEARRLSQEFRSLADNLPDLVVRVDQRRRLTYANGNVLQLIQVSLEQLAQLTFSELSRTLGIPEHIGQLWMQAADQVFASGESQTLESTLRIPSGEYCFEIRLAPEYDATGQVNSILIVSRDITAAREAAASIHAMHAELAARVAELERHTVELTILAELSAAAQACETLVDVYAVIAEHTRRLFPEDSGALLLLRSDQTSVQPVTSWGNHAGHIYATCVHLEQMLAAGELYERRADSAPPQPDSGSCVVCVEQAHLLLVPLLVRGRFLGALHLGLSQQAAGAGLASPRIYHARRQLAAALAEQIALALANLQLREELRQQAIRDPLTGLYNRRFMTETLTQEIRRAARKDRALGLIMLDIDYFKHFNDSYGHPAGDALLVEIAELLRRNTRGEDSVCRYGGEEFLLLLPEATLEDTRRRAEELRERVQLLSITYLGRQLPNVTLSLGVSVYPEHGSDSATLVQAADTALYQAKSLGRNRVVVAHWQPAPL